jgi:dienelactone hydrolase
MMRKYFVEAKRRLAGKPAITIFACCFLVLTGNAAAKPGSFPEPGSLPAQTNFPDPLVMFDGRKVSSAAQWEKERKPELKRLFQHYMYGNIPSAPEHTKIESHGEYNDFLEGAATLQLVTLETGTEGAPKIDLMLVIPNHRKAPVPVFLAMDFCGNHALTKDSRVPLSKTWMGNGCKGCTSNAATEAARGAQEADWPLAEIVRRGYALAAFYSGDVDSDRKDASTGLYAWLNREHPERNTPADRGTLAAWAWGYHRCVDYLVTQPAIDAHRIAAVGHSRNGKTALLAAAFDERISIAFPHQAGCGGSAPSRSKNGESVKAINTSFPHWFNEKFKQFNEATERLPFEQNCLVALCAPRPVLFSAAEGDQWANPAGQFEILKAASPVYRLLGVEGLTASQMPTQRQLVASRLGYYIREGKHSMTADDWGVFMDFAARQWQSAPAERVP